MFVKCWPTTGFQMSAPHPTPENNPADPVEEIVPLIPIVLPVVGGVMMLLLAFIAVSMA
jgi:hypothetical protein